MPSFFPPKGSFHPLGGQVFEYIIHEADEASDPRYYGYADHRGAWIIMQQTISTGAHRYDTGKSGFPAKWTGRAGLSYDYYYNKV